MFLAAKLLDFEDVSERIQYLVTQVEEITKIDNFGAYLTAMLEIDAFFMNEDRHTNNIAVIYNETYIIHGTAVKVAESHIVTVFC